MTFALNEEGRGVNRKRVRRLMRVMGIEALVPRPGTSRAAPGHKIHAYLLRGVAITEPNHVWAYDITYIPMARGFLSLVAIIDWASRAVLSWRLSNTMDTRFCVEALVRYWIPSRGSLRTCSQPSLYNLRRPHQALNNQMPMAVWRAGVEMNEAAVKAVDMPLRLDNANALPTYPQRKQKQQKQAA